MYWSVGQAGQGWCGLVRGEAGLTRCTLPLSDRESAAAVVSLEAAEISSDDLLDEAAQLLRAYYRGERVSFRLPLAPAQMTEFGEAVLRACAEIDYGVTCTYGELAAAVGAPRAARAVGQALGRNPLPVIVPCHRVIGSDGRSKFP